MKQFETSTTIAASPDRVWEVLADTAAWPEWDSGVLGVEGEPARGNRIKIRSELNPKRAYPVKVTELEPNRRMAWLGGMPLGLFGECGPTRSLQRGRGARGSRCARSSRARCFRSSGARSRT